MTRKEKFLLALAAVLLSVAFYYAGESDYVDERITEMKNNGSYERLYSPNLSDSDIVKLYDEEKK